jgi:DNA-binding transcriptional ArsR family regulator
MPLEAHSDVFAAIGNPGRRAILDHLRSGDRTVSALAEPFSMTLPAVSQHLRVLRRAGLVGERREGRHRVYHLTPEPLKDVRDWMRHYDKFWSRKLRDLGEYLDRTKRKGDKDGRHH